MSRSPSQMTTTVPVAKAKAGARATKYLGPPSRYKSSGEQCHSNLMGAHPHKVLKVVNTKNFTKVISNYHVRGSTIKYHRWPDPEVLCSWANCILQCPTGDHCLLELCSVQPTDLDAAALAWTSYQSCCVALESHGSASAMGRCLQLMPPVPVGTGSTVPTFLMLSSVDSSWLQPFLPSWRRVSH